MGRDIREEDTSHCNMVSVCTSICVRIQVSVCWQVQHRGALNVRSLEKESIQGQTGESIEYIKITYRGERERKEGGKRKKEKGKKKREKQRRKKK